MTELPASSADLYIDDVELARAFRSSLSIRAADLLDLAGAVYRRDRLTPRRAPGRRRDPEERSWSRTIELTVLLREPAAFVSTAAELELLLGWLSDDRWHLSFEERKGALGVAESQGFLFDERPHPDSTVALFSGGLDSFAGAAHLLAHSAHPVVLVAATTNTRAGAPQRSLARAMQWQDRRLRILPVRVALRGLGPTRQEHSQRTRAFLFFALAAATADGAGLSRLAISENGIGAMNLPYLHAQTGAHLSKAAHPRTLLLMNRFLGSLFDRTPKIAQPLFWQTKAETIASLASSWHELIPQTASCDSAFTNRTRGSHLCGQCSSCLLRRQALHSASLANIDRAERYRFDALAAAELDPRLGQLRHMLTQVRALRRALDEADPWAALISERFVDLVTVRDSLVALGENAKDTTVVEQRLLTLLQQYVGEWDAFPSPLVRAAHRDSLDDLASALRPSRSA